MITAMGAVSHTKKALTFIEELAGRNNTLYTSTKDSIREMIENCLNIVEIGESLLGDPGRISRNGYLANSNLQTGNTVSREEFNMLLQAVKQTADNVNGLTAAVMDMTGTQPVRRSSSVQSADVSDKHDEDDDPKGGSPILEKPNSRADKIKKNQQIVSNLGDAIARVDRKLQKSTEIPECLNLSRAIKDWFKYRIQELDTAKCKFRYHASNLIEYIRAIVIDYSSASDRSEWLSNFNKWLQKVRNNDPTVSSYALPYDTFQIFKKSKNKRCKDMPEKFRFNALWTLLLDSGLYCTMLDRQDVLAPYEYSCDNESGYATPRDIWYYAERQALA